MRRVRRATIIGLVVTSAFLPILAGGCSGGGGGGDGGPTEWIVTINACDPNTYAASGVVRIDKTKEQLIADQIEDIEDPEIKQTYTNLVSESLNGASSGFSGLVPLWKIQQANGGRRGTFEDMQTLVDAGVVRAVTKVVGYIPVLLDKGAPVKETKASAQSSHVTPESLVAALRKVG